MPKPSKPPKPKPPKDDRRRPLLAWIGGLFDRWRPPRPQKAKDFCILFVFVHHQPPKEAIVMANPIELKAGQGATVTATITGASGQPARVDGTPAWTAEPADGLSSLTPSSDGMTCQIIAGSETQAVLVSMTVDADLGEGVRELIGTLEAHVQADVPVEEEATFIQLDANPNEINPLGKK